MEYGFLRSVESLERKFPGQKIIICFDTKNNKKKEKYPERYKANRTKMKDKFYERLNELQNFLLNFWDSAWQEGEEADDVMYSIAKNTEEVVYLYSNDNDLLQCINETTFVLKSHESSLYIWDEEKVKEKYGVPPELLVMLRSFVGDSSDNLDGVPRIQKRILVDAIYYALANGWTEPEHIAEHVIDYTSWSPAMLIKLHEFSRSGLWAENYELMKLQECEYVYAEQKLTEEYVVLKLKEWEIGSLNLCKPYSGQLVDSESEF